ncbi:MAG TPA: NAD-dependent epimerase/dehydratase family protein [Verrucomicrobiae bacterium]|nr:NAD-dependent epimerase/dehydratase family protein [Verrucomicrobiae bacterium]
MRVSVTGGTGFVGRALVRRLLAQGVSVKVLGRPSERAERLRALGAQVVEGDLEDPGSVERAVQGADIVYHLAAKVDRPGTRGEFVETNVRGTERVFTACRRLGGVSRVIYTSSVAVYGLVQPGQSIDEDAPYDAAPQLRDSYAQSKILAEQFAISFSQKTGLPAVIFRPGLIYGAGKPLPLGLLGFRLWNTDFVFGDRNLRLPLNYVENLIDAMQLASSLKDNRLRQFNIVDDEELTLGQYHETKSAEEKTRTVFLPGGLVLFGAPLAESFVRAASRGGTTGLSQHQVKRALQDRSYGTRRIREELGWMPRVQLREAIQRSLRNPD